MGSISGLRARGGILVSISWSEEEIKAVLHSDNTQEVMVRVAGLEVQRIELEAGKDFEILKRY